MTVRRVVLYAATTLALGHIAACGVILYGVDRLERKGWL